MKRRLLTIILAHMVGSYCAVGFYFVDNYGASGFPFGGILAPFYVLPDYVISTARWESMDSDSKWVLALYWIAYLVPLVAIVAFAEWHRRTKGPNRIAPDVESTSSQA
jgi:hypothetical protein